MYVIYKSFFLYNFTCVCVYTLSISQTVYYFIFTETKLQIATSIIKYNIPMPICSYSETSRRRNNYNNNNNNNINNNTPIDNDDNTEVTSTTITPQKSIYEQLKVLDGWDKYPEIAIDGQNGTTKSTIAKNINRRYLKINDICSSITAGSDYNHHPLKAVDYLMYQALAKADNVIWDRSMYSNLIFYFVHHLMALHSNMPIPDDDAKIWPLLNNMALDVGLLKTLQFIDTIKNVPTIFIVCSHVDFICESLRNRGIETQSLNDIWNSKEYNYQLAQYHVYRWFGKLAHIPTFDLMDFFIAGYTTGHMQTMISSKIDRHTTEYTLQLPTLFAFEDFDKILNKYEDDILVYEHSKK